MNRADIEHEPVLCEPLLALTAPRPGEIVVDATVGHGGHARLLGQSLGPTGRLVGLDVDPVNLERARNRLERAFVGEAGPHLDLVQASFSDLDATLDELGIGRADVIVADLGVTTDQLLDSSRGLTFGEDGPLDMRFDERLPETAADLINRLPERELADLIYHHSQERFSRRIAKSICQARRDRRLRRTSELVRIVCSALGASEATHRGKIHPATRTFLAFRIAVNRENERLRALLGSAPQRLSAGGRIAIISFHSGEDRVVKRDFLDRRRDGEYEIVTKKPIVPTSEEVRRNPRSRSAKLRVAVRTAERRGAA